MCTKLPVTMVGVWVAQLYVGETQVITKVQCKRVFQGYNDLGILLKQYTR